MSGVHVLIPHFQMKIKYVVISGANSSKDDWSVCCGQLNESEVLTLQTMSLRWSAHAFSCLDTVACQRGSMTLSELYVV